MNCSPPGSTVRGISQARILEWVALSSSRGSSWLRDWTFVYCIAVGFFIAGPAGKPHSELAVMSCMLVYLRTDCALVGNSLSSSFLLSRIYSWCEDAGPWEEHLDLREALVCSLMSAPSFFYQWRKWVLTKEAVSEAGIRAWKIPWREEPGGLQHMESQRVAHTWATERTHTDTHTRRGVGLQRVTSVFYLFFFFTFLLFF